jgi:hypothetical protein
MYSGDREISIGKHNRYLNIISSELSYIIPASTKG